MANVEYVVRDSAGGVRTGTFPEGDPSTVYVSFSKDVSLNLSASDVIAYTRQGGDLVVQLSSGETLVLSGYFDEAATGPKNLFLSEQGNLVEVFLGDAAEGDIVASYAAMDVSGKWSAYDDLVFLDLGRVEPVVAPLAAPIISPWLLGGGAAAAGAAAIGGGGGGGGGDTDPPPVTIDTVEGDDTISRAEASDGVTLTGISEEGATITVEWQGITRTVTAGTGGAWSMDFAASEITGGTYNSDIVVMASDAAGNTTTLTHTVHIDTEVAVTLDATVGGDTVISGAEQSAGVTFNGTAEAGATVEVTMGTVTHTVVASSTGAYSVTFASHEIATGTYDTTITATATDTVGNTETVTHSIHVDTETTVAIDSGLAGGDDVINAAEAAAAVTLTGNAEAGSSVEVTVEGVSRMATVASDGSWSVVFGAGTIPAGEYNTTVTAVSTDAYGNAATSTAAIRVDTVAGDVALSPLPIEIDDVINFVERSDGVVINGTATPGIDVTVSLGGATQVVTASASGNWSITVPASDIPTGTRTLPIEASITDGAGNSKSVTDTVELDTLVENFTNTSTEGGTDGVVSASEMASGINLTGTVEAGSTVTVQLHGVTRPASVDALGNWSVNFPNGSLPTGTYNASMTVTATDRAGNVDTITDTVSIDTEASVAVQPNQTADDVVNAAEHAAGVTLAGTSEPGSTVNVVLAGVSVAASVDAAGNWTATFNPSDLPEGTYTATATITATDRAGNSTSVSESFQVDTEIETPDIDSVTFAGSDVWRIGTQDIVDSHEVNTLEAGGAVGSPSSSMTTHAALGTEFTFGSPIPDGTDLVVTRTDAAGNSASTLLVNTDNATNATTLDHSGVGGFDIAALNLEYADDANLVLTEAQIKAMAGHTDELTIHGGSDDTITVSGAVDTGSTRTIDGQTYNVYTIGSDGATLVVEQDVNVII